MNVLLGVAGLVIVFALTTAGLCLLGQHQRRAGGSPAPGDGHHPAREGSPPPAPGNNPVPGDARDAVYPPSRPPSPAPGPWHASPCGCAIRHDPPGILTCPRHASRREDILHLLQWAEELKDELAGCACAGTGWVTIPGPGGTVIERPCRDCLGQEQR